MLDNFDFTRKIVEKLLVEKLMKMLRFLTTLISREKLSKIFRVKTRENVGGLTTLISREKLFESKVLSKLNFWTKI